MNSLGQLLRTGTGATPAVVFDPYIPGDLNDDGGVNIADLARLLINFGGSADNGHEQGDIDCSGSVDLSDLSTVLRNFGQRLP